MVTEQLHNLQQRVNKMFLLRNRPGKIASTPLRGVHILSQVGNENNWTFSLTHRHTHMWTVNTNDPFSGTEKLWNLWEIMEFREIMVKLWTPFLYLFSAHLRKVCKPVAWVGGSGSSWRAWPLVEGTWATSALPGSPLTSLSLRLFPSLGEAGKLSDGLQSQGHREQVDGLTAQLGVYTAWFKLSWWDSTARTHIFLLLLSCHQTFSSPIAPLRCVEFPATSFEISGWAPHVPCSLPTTCLCHHLLRPATAQAAN